VNFPRILRNLKGIPRQLGSLAPVPAEGVGTANAPKEREAQQIMGMAAPAILTNRPVIDADGYPAARARRPDAPGRAQGFEGQQRAAAILAFPQRLAGQYAREDEPGGRSSGGAQWRNSAGLPLPTSAFLAQHIAQERLTTGLTLDPHAGATGAYARSGRLASPATGPLVDLSI